MEVKHTADRILMKHLRDLIQNGTALTNVVQDGTADIVEELRNLGSAISGLKNAIPDMSEFLHGMTPGNGIPVEDIDELSAARVALKAVDVLIEDARTGFENSNGKKRQELMLDLIDDIQGAIA